MTIQPEEDSLNEQLEMLEVAMKTLTQVRGRLNKLLIQVGVQSQAHVMSGSEKYRLDQFAITGINAVLTDQQSDINSLVGLIKEDIIDLLTVMEGLTLTDLVYSQPWVQSEEETLHSQLETLQAELDTPTQLMLNQDRL